ncbi:MAG: fructose-6-phosphate aldolase [Dehalobacter sp. 4CP]|jgi:transaldolase|uniref:fructose-6-phosphate aldolase n=1 Tax=Dehalobacter sp. CP TaxID=2594474 RepID=UPI0013C73EBC|nr:fructose-6-phosphate aldolase [Dehalobacter sp.]NBJ15851.1 fructose-6-phosphate aldolase [Dehalobacter sp. 4CP]
MRFFLDSANTEEISRAWDMGVIAGVTTNPSLVAREKEDFHTLIHKIAGIVDGPISAEVIALDYEGMLQEARQLADIHPNIVVKIPMTLDGLKAVKTLREEDIQTNVTLVFSPVQALMAARAGAAYVSPFLGRLDDIGEVGMNVLADICEIFEVHDLDCGVIAASIRHPVHVLEAAKIGADFATIPFGVLSKLSEHPLTSAGINKFLDDWKKLS